MHKIIYLFSVVVLLYLPACSPNSCSHPQAVDSLPQPANADEIVKNFRKPGKLITSVHPAYDPHARLIIIPVSHANRPWNPVISKDYIFRSIFGESDFTRFFRENMYNNSFYINIPQICDPVFTHTIVNDGSTMLGGDLLTAILQNADLDWAAIDENHDHIIAHNEAVLLLMRCDASGTAWNQRLGDYEDASGMPTASSHYGEAITYHGQPYSIKTDMAEWHCKIVGTGQLVTDNFNGKLRSLLSVFYHLTIWGTECNYSGNYSEMYNSCQSAMHLSAYEKFLMGWLHPRIINAADIRSGRVNYDCMSLNASERYNDALLIYNNSGDGNRDDQQQYFLIENRHWQQSEFGLDTVADPGLVVYWGNTINQHQFIVTPNEAGTTVAIPPTYTNNERHYGKSFKAGLDMPENGFPLLGIGAREFCRIRPVSEPGRIMTFKLLRE